MIFIVFVILSIVMITKNLKLIKISLNETVIWAGSGMILSGLYSIVRNDIVIVISFFIAFNIYLFIKSDFKSVIMNIVVGGIIYIIPLALTAGIDFGKEGIGDVVSIISVYGIQQMIAVFVGINIVRKISKINRYEKNKYLLLLGVSIWIIGRTLTALVELSKRNNTIIELVELNKGTVLTSLVAAVFIIGFIVIDIRKNIASEHKKQELESMREYSKNMETMYDHMRRFKHDHVNIMSSIYGYIEDSDVDGMKKYFKDNIIKETQEGLCDFNFGDLRMVRLVELRGLISSKIIRAREAGVGVYLDIQDVIEAINMESIDLCRAVGIIFDNAIEECRMNEGFEVQIGIIKGDKDSKIIVKNPYTGDIIPISKFYKSGFSTKGENRGIGLSSLREIINKYYNVNLETSLEDGFFTQVIEIG